MKTYTQYRWYRFKVGDAYHYIGYDLNTLQTCMRNFARRHNWKFIRRRTSANSMIIERIR